MDGRLKLARQEAAQADPGRRARQRNQACVGASFLGSVFWTSKKWNSRCARRCWKNRSIDERETHTTSLDMNAEDNKRKIRFVGLNTWKARWHCFVANQALLLPPRLSATAPSTFLSTATKRYQKMPPRFPAVSCASRPSRGSADTSLRDGRRRPSMACPFGLIPAAPAMLGRAKGKRGCHAAGLVGSYLEALTTETRHLCVGKWSFTLGRQLLHALPALPTSLWVVNSHFPP